MNESLRHESERLARSWMRHEAGWLRDYLVAGVEDPRLNLQSVLSRHFLVRAVSGNRFGALMEQELRFAAVMNWLIALAGQASEPEELRAVLLALERGADNAEGIALPAFVRRVFQSLPCAADSLRVPNYVEAFLAGTEFEEGRARVHRPSLDTFQHLWVRALAFAPSKDAGSGPGAGLEGTQRLSVLEPACGSANDYRFLHAYGLVSLVDYRGFDLCAKNVENARGLFPGARFDVGNVFAIEAPDAAFDLCVVHDLFEHLSPAGLEAAVGEVCRVVRRALCLGFFSMDEIPEHVVRPIDEYHWNTLSMARVRELFARHGFKGQVLHLATFLRDLLGCESTHNPNAYTFVLHRVATGEAEFA